MRYRIALAAVLAVVGCKDNSTSEGRSATASASEPTVVKPKSVTPAELAKMLEGGKARAVDANGPGTRKTIGAVPGAVLLAKPPRLNELPKDKTQPLVFYCYNKS